MIERRLCRHWDRQMSISDLWNQQQDLSDRWHHRWNFLSDAIASNLFSLNAHNDRCCITDTLIELTIAMLFRHQSAHATCMSSTKVQNHTTNTHWKTCWWLSFTHTHTPTYWCIMLTQSILDQIIAFVVSCWKYFANVSIYIWSCMHTHCDWHTHHMHIHMRSLVGLHS